MQVMELLIQVVFVLLGFLCSYILYGMREEMKSTRAELTALAQSVAVMVAKSAWHEKILDNHDNRITKLED